MRRTASTGSAVLAATCALLVASCGQGAGDGANPPVRVTSTEGSGDLPLTGTTITVGSKNFDEQLILGQILLKVFEDAGADVVDSTNLAGTNAVRDALTTGQIDTYWEYTGTGWLLLLGNTDPIPGSQAQWEAVKAQDAERNDIAWLPYAPLDNTFALAEKAAGGPDLATLSDWAVWVAENPDQATICVDAESANRDDGLPGLEKAYGVDVPESNLALVELGVVYESIGSRTCTFGVVSTTDGRLEANGLEIIEDDLGFFPVYNPALTFRQDRLAELPAVDQVVAPVVEALTTKEITALNRRVSVDGERPETVATDWLTENGLIS